MSKWTAKPGQRFASWFRWELSTIEAAYTASRGATDQKLDESRLREEKFREEVSNGNATWQEYDEDGNVTFDYGEQLGEEQYDQEKTLTLIRHAFLIVLYHYWERRLTALLQSDESGGLKYSPNASFSQLEKFGWHPQKQKLEELRLIANCAKHGEGKSASELYDKRPDLFIASDIEEGSPPDYETLLISDANVKEYFDAIKQSVPAMGLML